MFEIYDDVHPRPIATAATLPNAMRAATAIITNMRVQLAANGEGSDNFVLRLEVQDRHGTLIRYTAAPTCEFAEFEERAHTFLGGPDPAVG